MKRDGEQGDMFPPEEAHTRRGDPDTSFEAAERASKNLSAARRAVLGLFMAANKPMTDHDMIFAYNEMHKTVPGLPKQTDSGLRTRRSELVRAGKVRFSGTYGVTPSGGRSRQWIIVR